MWETGNCNRNMSRLIASGKKSYLGLACLDVGSIHGNGKISSEAGTRDNYGEADLLVQKHNHLPTVHSKISLNSFFSERKRTQSD